MSWRICARLTKIAFWPARCVLDRPTSRSILGGGEATKHYQHYQHYLHYSYDQHALHALYAEHVGHSEFTRRPRPPIPLGFRCIVATTPPIRGAVRRSAAPKTPLEAVWGGSASEPIRGAVRRSAAVKKHPDQIRRPETHRSAIRRPRSECYSRGVFELQDMRKVNQNCILASAMCFMRGPKVEITLPPPIAMMCWKGVLTGGLLSGKSGDLTSRIFSPSGSLQSCLAVVLFGCLAVCLHDCIAV